jgi:H+-translocating NAD(P) transhydrogenase subunit alpha
MQNLTPNDLLERAQAAAEVAREAAASAKASADQVALMVGGLAHGAIDPLIFQLSLFTLAVFVGYYVVWAVTPALHTPLMSVTNAISSVIVVGAVMAVGVPLLDGNAGNSLWARGFGFFGVILATINIVGGFLVTQRMLAMYKRKPTVAKAD